jgi:hypothetical protein
MMMPYLGLVEELKLKVDIAISIAHDATCSFRVGHAQAAQVQAGPQRFSEICERNAAAAEAHESQHIITVRDCRTHPRHLLRPAWGCCAAARRAPLNRVEVKVQRVKLFKQQLWCACCSPLLIPMHTMRTAALKARERAIITMNTIDPVLRTSQAFFFVVTVHARCVSPAAQLQQFNSFCLGKALEARDQLL